MHSGRKRGRGGMEWEKKKYRLSVLLLSSELRWVPLMRKNEMLPTREESILSFTCSPCLFLCLSFCHCLVLFSSAYHIRASARGVPVSWSHQSQISHSRTNAAPGRRPDTLARRRQLHRTAERRHTWQTSDCISVHLWEFFFLWAFYGCLCF